MFKGKREKGEKRDKMRKKKEKRKKKGKLRFEEWSREIVRVGK